MAKKSETRQLTELVAVRFTPADLDALRVGSRRVAASLCSSCCATAAWAACAPPPDDTHTARLCAPPPGNEQMGPGAAISLGSVPSVWGGGAFSEIHECPRHG